MKWTFLSLISISFSPNEICAFLSCHAVTGRCLRTANIKTSSYKIVMSSETRVKAQPPKNDSRDFPILNVDPKDTGLKVSPTAWKWPVGWPYTEEYFSRENVQPDFEFYQSALGSIGNSKVFDGEQLDALQNHFKRFIPQGSDLLEIGAGAHSYIPVGLARTRHVGVGLSKSEMDSNKDLTDPPIEQDLNANHELIFPDESFDTVLISNSIEFFTDPASLMREVNRVLRPGGYCLVSFTGKDVYKPLNPKKIKMWRDMNDAQHMWVIGSFFHFSGSDSWSELKGYDLTPSKSQGILSNFGGGKSEVFVVQARREIRSDNPEIIIKSWLKQCPSIEADEYDFCTLRFLSEIGKAASHEEKEKLLESVKMLPKVFKVLSKMKKGVLFPPYKALLAVRLVVNGFNGSNEQIAALNEGLGIEKPGDDFWAPLGKITMQMSPEDKVILLADLVPLFGTSLAKPVVPKILPILEKTMKIVEQNMRSAEPADVQLLSTDLIITDYIFAGDNQESFLPWLESVSPEDLESWLDERKRYKEVAKLPISEETS